MLREELAGVPLRLPEPSAAVESKLALLEDYAARDAARLTVHPKTL